MSTAQKLLADVERFLEKTGMPATTFGLRVANDGHLVRDLRSGRDIRASQIDRIRDYMSGYDSAPERRAG